MKRLIHQITQALETDPGSILISLLATRGSTPQIPGASALFRGNRLLSGTLGGGVMEHTAALKAEAATRTGQSIIFDFELNADIEAVEGAICGGAATLLLDANPGRKRDVFNTMVQLLQEGKAGVLVTLVEGEGQVEIERDWVEAGASIPARWAVHENRIRDCLAKMECHYEILNSKERIFFHPVAPMPDLVIAGAGHIGTALAHHGRLLDFKVTVIDHRPDFANREHLPDADRIILEPVGQALQKLPHTDHTYIVIVTHGHRDDAEALRACIASSVPYIGMIGSKRKVRLMREEFLRQSWATGEQFDRVHAPVGLEINAQTVQEIAFSISAQLVQVRNAGVGMNAGNIDAIVLAAGASRRMGKPKMLLPFGKQSILGSVLSAAEGSRLDKTILVLGAHAELVKAVTEGHRVVTVNNIDHQHGMLSSLQCGLRSINDDARAVLILLGDQPMVESETIDRLITAFYSTQKEIVVASYKQRRGHPILVGKKHFREILALSEEQSLRDLLSRHPDDIEEVESGKTWVLRDIDTEQEYLEELNNQRI